MGGRIKVKKATKPKKGPTKYPFRFYGHDPDDYFDSLQYEVRFESAPDRAMRADIADQATHQLFDSAAEFHGAWHWSESFVRFTALAHGSSSTGGAMHAIAKMLRSLHDVAPIAQVVAFHVREPGRGAWDRATLKAQPDPDPGPPYDPPVAYGYPYGAPRAIDATLPVATVDDEVEELRRTLERDGSTRSTLPTEWRTWPTKHRDVSTTSRFSGIAGCCGSGRRSSYLTRRAGPCWTDS
jgi:hypothetical protein